MYYTQMLQIMHVQVSYANQLATTKILGQSHIFHVLLQAQNKSWCVTEKEGICSPEKHTVGRLLP